ncbi:CHRD domain-containing protein [Allosphingosinicella sp.]|uniref:CHRD domain-containing protein n=1 Tax=Allosphingosinicella sp. TaxID=2823234 RepID=UPI003784A132
MRMRILTMIAATALLATAADGQQRNPNRRATLYVSMTGLQEVPGPGDPDGNGTVELRVVPRQGSICWNLYARAIGTATAAHIHRGGAGANGPPVLALTTPDANGRSQGCATVDPNLAREIGMMPQEFYVNVHNEALPGGAIRGQLRDISAPFQPIQQQRTGG